MLTCFIVDDEQAAIENLQLLLEKYCFNVKIEGYARSITDALQYLNHNKPDILFLDIRLQNETGFDLLERVHQQHFSLIFVTAYDDYGIKAIKFSATDYLLKPVNATELTEAVNKVARLKKSVDNTAQLNMLLQSFENIRNHEQKKIALSDANQIRYVLISDIICCKSDNTYTTFYLQDQEKIMVSRKLLEYENILESYGFLRVHQSYLINKNKIVAYKKEDGGSLLMENNLSVPISRQRKFLLNNIL